MLLAAPTALDALHEVFARVATVALPETAAAALALSKLTALNKLGSGVRLIAQCMKGRPGAGRGQRPVSQQLVQVIHRK